MLKEERDVINKFHDLYYNGLSGENQIFMNTYWMNIPCFKCPLDLWIYQEIVAQLHPDLIIETGTYMGGSALYLAHILDAVGKGEIITFDIKEYGEKPKHPRIRYVTGSSSDQELVKSLLDSRPPNEQRFVILDSDHSKKHVSDELRLLSPYVSLGSYIIVEDTNVNGHPTYPSFGEGPYEAVQEFLKYNPNFVVDESREKLLMTFNPSGYLKRIS